MRKRNKIINQFCGTWNIHPESYV